MHSAVAVEKDSVFVSPHAVERYCERLRPGLSVHSGRVELARLLESAGQWVQTPPDWANIQVKPGSRYILVGEDVLFIVVHRHLATCLTKYGDAHMRSNIGIRKQARKKQRQHVRLTSRPEGKRAGAYRRHTLNDLRLSDPE